MFRIRVLNYLFHQHIHACLFYPQGARDDQNPSGDRQIMDIAKSSAEEVCEPSRPSDLGPASVPKVRIKFKEEVIIKQISKVCILYCKTSTEWDEKTQKTTSHVTGSVHPEMKV